MSTKKIRFSAIGLNHGHIYGQTDLLLRAGAELVSFYSAEADLAGKYAETYPQAKPTTTQLEILEDETIDLVISAAIPADRAPLGIQVMKHGKDYMSDKPGFTTLDQLEEARRVVKDTSRIYSICYSERFENPASVRAGELVYAGAIGQVVEVIGLGPHRTNLPTRAEWFFQRERYGGILTDIGSHQADQFLYYTGATAAEVIESQVANYKHPQYPELEDYGHMVLQTENASGYFRVDWYTPNGLDTWGDGRLFILGTEGYIEARKYTDISGRPGGAHLFWVDQKEPHYEDCKNIELPYGKQLISDIIHRSETAMTQHHCFLASELVLKAEAKARRLGNLESV